MSIQIVVSEGHYGPPINMVDYTPRPIIISCIKAIYWTNEFRWVAFRHCFRNAWKANTVPKLQQKSSHQKGGQTWSTAHHDQLSYQIWKLSDHRSQGSCIHYVTRDEQTNERRDRQPICPYCRMRVIKELAMKYKKKMCFQFSKIAL